jgi:hypothetical protein
MKTPAEPSRLLLSLRLPSTWLDHLANLQKSLSGREDDGLASANIQESSIFQRYRAQQGDPLRKSASELNIRT